MDLKLWASFSVICILLHCCQICESKPRPGACRGLIKGHKNCPSSSIGFDKRLLESIMKRTGDVTGNDNELWDDELRTVDDAELGKRQPADWGFGTGGNDDDSRANLATRDNEEEELRRKELELLFVRALLDDLENETFDDK